MDFHTIAWTLCFSRKYLNYLCKLAIIFFFMLQEVTPEKANTTLINSIQDDMGSKCGFFFAMNKNLHKPESNDDVLLQQVATTEMFLTRSAIVRDLCAYNVN
jgi:hypothetical protein